MTGTRSAAIYARVSTDRQSELSPVSQIRKCREAAEARGFRVRDEHVFIDEAMSGVGNDRPDFQRMMTLALEKPRPFDAIFVDDTSRLSRSTKDALAVFERLNFAGVQLIAVSQAIDSADEQAHVLVTVHGLVDSLYVKELAKKTHRGLEERALRRLHTGGRIYGYSSEVTDGGKRLVVNETEARVVRRIFADYADGRSLRTIAKTLNAERVPPPRPRAGREAAGWCPTAIREMLRNSRYAGRVVWNRNRFIKEPGTNRRVARPRPRSEWSTVDVPDQRIVSDRLWDAVQTQIAWVADTFGTGRPGLLIRNANSPHLFSGLLFCAECGGRLVVITGHGKNRHSRYGCSRNFYRGTCTNGLREREDRLDTSLLDGLQRTVEKEAATDYTARYFERYLRGRLGSQNGGIERLKGRRAKLEMELRNLADTAAQAGPSTFLANSIAEREREIREISDQISSVSSSSNHFTVTNLREFVTSRLLDIRRLLTADVERARAELARHVSRIEMRPTGLRNGSRFYTATGQWSLFGTRFDTWPGGGYRMVAGAGFEPATSGL